MNRPPSLERLISPDQSDALPAVSHPPKRLFVYGSLILVLIAIAWLGFGLIDTRIKGRCILVSPQGMAEVTSAAEGRLQGLAVKVGDFVEPGQMIARLSRPEFEQARQKANARLTELRERKQIAEALISRSLALGAGVGANEQTILAGRGKTLAARLALARQRLATQQSLFQEGLVTRQSLLAAEQQLEALSLEYAQLNSRASQQSFLLQEEQRKQKNELNLLGLQVDEAAREVALLAAQDASSMQIRSVFAGRVVEIKAQNGMVLSMGSNILTLERSVGNTEAAAAEIRLPLVALVFVDAAQGKLLHVGMPVEITPTNVKRQEFGFIRSAISTVSNFPSSSLGIQQLLQNPSVVKELTGEKVPAQFQATLLTRADGAYAWSGAARQPPVVRSGSMCAAEIVVRQRAPYEYVWPLLKKFSGLV